jgi:large subunit ribosomal protein L22
MSKAKTQRKYASNQAFATLRSLRCSPRKVALVAGLIRGASAATALQQLAFSRKAVAIQVKELLKSAIANAENNHNLDIDRLFVKEVLVGKGIVMKRFAARARGRASRIQKPFSNITIVLEQSAE